MAYFRCGTCDEPQAVLINKKNQTRYVAHQRGDQPCENSGMRVDNRPARKRGDEGRRSSLSLEAVVAAEMGKDRKPDDFMCPKCKASPGWPCRSEAGNPVKTHADRKALAAPA